ncbi:MAG: acyltransferase [Cyanophyceae cyanobacterium]
MDYAKGIGIFLVVLGHTLRGVVDVVFAAAPWTEALDRWIYAFHMPLFFLLSGLFIERAVRKPWGVSVGSKAKTILYPYLIWSVLQELLRAASGIREAPLTDLWRIAYEPVMQFWFLYVLFLLSMGYIALRKWGGSVALFLGLMGVLWGLEVAGVELGPWSVVYTLRASGIYFALGAIAQRYGTLRLLEGRSRGSLVAAAIAGFGVIAVAVWGLTFPSGVVPFEPVPLPKIWTLPLAIVGMGASLALAKAMEGIAALDFVKAWGARSLEIFVAHTIFSAALRVVLQKLGVEVPLVHLLAGTVIGLYGPMALVALGQRLRFPYLFRWPTARPS